MKITTLVLVLALIALASATARRRPRAAQGAGRQQQQQRRWRYRPAQAAQTRGAAAGRRGQRRPSGRTAGQAVARGGAGVGGALQQAAGAGAGIGGGASLGAAPQQSQGGNAAASAGDGPSASALALLRSREGFRNKVYRDSLGKPTAGTGHLMRPQDLARYPVGSTIPQAQLDQWLQQDAQGAWNAARRQAQQYGIRDPKTIDELTSLNFQLGTGWQNKFRTMASQMQAGNFNGAAAAAQRTAWARQTPNRVQDFVNAMRHEAQLRQGQ